MVWFADERHTDAMVGGTGAAGPPPDLRHQPPGQRYFLLKSRDRDRPRINLHNMGYTRGNSGISHNQVKTKKIFQG